MARFRPHQRLRTRAQFDRVFRQGARADGRLFLLIAAANGRPEDRLGLTVSRRVGEAVARNRVRRLLRESFRVLQRGSRPPADLVVLAKTEITGSGLREIARELSERLRRLERSHRLGGSRPAPAR